MATGNRPTAAFVLTLIGGVLVLIGGLALITIGALFGAAGSMAGSAGFGVPGAIIGGTGYLAAGFGVLGLALGVLLIIASTKINSTNPSKIKTWSILALVFSLVSLIAGSGFFIGFILALVGSILGLVHKG